MGVASAGGAPGRDTGGSGLGVLMSKNRMVPSVEQLARTEGTCGEKRTW